MLDVVDLFREKGTVDELGLGPIRDAFADRLFPGTSTLQSRTRYWLLIPWLYLQLEAERRVPPTRTSVLGDSRQTSFGHSKPATNLKV